MARVRGVLQGHGRIGPRSLRLRRAATSSASTFVGSDSTSSPRLAVRIRFWLPVATAVTAPRGATGESSSASWSAATSSTSNSIRRSAR